MSIKSLKIGLEMTEKRFRCLTKLTPIFIQFIQLHTVYCIGIFIKNI